MNREEHWEVGIPTVIPMPISKEHRVIFLHVPKNAGSSVEEALSIRASEDALLSKKYSPRFVYAMQHLPYDELRQALPPEVWEGYTKVCVVRNPWDRLVSDWRWRQKGNLPLGNLSFPDFVRFVRDVVSEPNWDRDCYSPSSGLVGNGGNDLKFRLFRKQYRGHFQRQVAYTGPPTSADANSRKVGGQHEMEDSVRILRFEHLSCDWHMFCREILGRELPLPFSNDSGRDPKSHYSDEYEAFGQASISSSASTSTTFTTSKVPPTSTLLAATSFQSTKAVVARPYDDDLVGRNRDVLACEPERNELVEIVRELYSQDVERFGYTYERSPLSCKGKKGGGDETSFKGLLGSLKNAGKMKKKRKLKEGGVADNQEARHGIDNNKMAVTTSGAIANTGGVAVRERLTAAPQHTTRSGVSVIDSDGPAESDRATKKMAKFEL